MTNCFILICISLIFPSMSIYSDISLETAYRLGDKIWKNECKGSIQGLTHWNQGENFGSFGIGHFIWYPKNKTDGFQETFPDLLKYLVSQGVVLPDWLKNAQVCPWKTREEFLQNIQSPDMIALRQLLLETKNLQAQFIVDKFEKSLPEMTKHLSPEEKNKILSIINALSKDFKGLYALVDYMNFKGSGASPSETYQGEGWGLLQVLIKVSPHSHSPLSDFAAAAKEVLKQRVTNAPPERHEERWLKGWFNRIDTYLQ
jgi:hypothetical protein